jgi:ribosomal protein S18 acetylase RimI-like enzyme
VTARIREFREDDYEAVLRVWREAGLTIKPSDTLPELRKVVDRNPGTFLVAEEEGTVVGTVIGAWDGRRAWVYHLAVLPAARGRGTGRMLMEELERRLRAIGATKLNLLIEPGNAAVGDFYRKLGYAPDDLLFMTRLLS